MKINKIETIWFKDKPKLVFLRIHTDDGISGIGETYEMPAAFESYIHSEGAKYLLGKSALDIDKHWTHFYRTPRLALGKSLEIRALSAIDMALWDILGKHLKQPIYQLLGGACREKIRVYNTCAGYDYVGDSGLGYHATGQGLDANRPYEDLHAFLHHADSLAESLLSEGYTQMKIWPFDRYAENNNGNFISLEELKQGLEPFSKIRQSVGDEIDIALELHNLWNLPSALKIANAVADYGAVWCEDPIPMDNIDSLVDMRQKCSIPICASETVGTRWGFREMFEKKAVDIVMPDITWTGGISESKKIAAMAECYNLPEAPHDCVGPLTYISGVHLSMNLPNALIQEVVRAYINGWYKDLVTDLPRIDNGYVFLPEGYGLGTDLNPGIFERSDLMCKVSHI